MGKVLIVWLDDGTSHNIPLSQNNPEQDPNSLQFYEV